MRASLLSYLACPECQGELCLSGGAAIEEIEEGELACAGCKAGYPIENGIPRLMPQGLLDAQMSEIAARDAQVVDYDAMWFLTLFGKIEVPMTLRRLSIVPTDTFLEAGCGTGRMTQEFAGRSWEVVALDFSFQSLCANRKKLCAAGVKNVHLLQADLCRLPFKSTSFDRAASCQVLEHVPTGSARKQAVSSISRVLKPGATLALSAYQHSFLTKEKQGMHDGGIPFFRFTRDEFRSLLSTAFEVESITGALVYLYLAKCRNKS
jgi:ubiquinone/menaquinone biosynthesis C-methylase UbiE/uncharacterized protein YbaR (Trm112 family)